MDRNKHSKFIEKMRGESTNTLLIACFNKIQNCTCKLRGFTHQSTQNAVVTGTRTVSSKTTG